VRDGDVVDCRAPLPRVGELVDVERAPLDDDRVLLVGAASKNSSSKSKKSMRCLGRDVRTKRSVRDTMDARENQVCAVSYERSLLLLCVIVQTIRCDEVDGITELFLDDASFEG